MSFNVRAAGRFMQALLSAANDQTFTPLSSIEAPIVANEDIGNTQRVIDVMEKQGHVEVTFDENGVPSIRLTPSGVTLANTLTEVHS